MRMVWISVLLVVVSNVTYHVSQKSIPSGANPIVSIIVFFAVALILSLCLLFFVGYEGSLIDEIKKLNWSPVLVGVSIIGIEAGYLLFYRSGWNISIGPVFCYSLVTLCLIPIGLFFFKEKLVTWNYLGIVMALAGIFLMTLKE